MNNEDGATNQTLDALIARIKSGQVYDGMSYRQLKRKNWSKLKRKKDLADAFKTLKEWDCVWLEDRRQGETKGRQSKVIRLHADVIVEQQQWAEEHEKQ
jgi:hypothetical protein